MGRSSDYGSGMYRQLMDIMGRLDSVEKEHKQEIKELKNEISELKKENKTLREENQLLKEDNARLKSIINNDRLAAFLNAASNGELGLSEGSVYSFCRNFAKSSEESISNLENELLNQGIVATDATIITVNGKQNYIRNFSIENTVVYRAMKQHCIISERNMRNAMYTLSVT